MPKFSQQEIRKGVTSYRGSSDTMQVWRIPGEKISINMLSERTEEAMRVYAKDTSSIPTVMEKYIPVQTNHEVTGEVLIETSDKTTPGLMLPEIVHNVKKKLGCISVENHWTGNMIWKRDNMITRL